MINRQNWLDVQKFLSYQLEIKQIAGRSANAQWSRLRHLLEWANELAFTDIMQKRPTFPAYVETLVTEQGTPFSASHLVAMFKTTRAFFLWARQEYPIRYKHVELNWIQSLRPSRGRSEASVLLERKLYTLEDVLQLVEVPAETTARRRMRAAVAFLFLSGMRIGAFCTLPLKCVNLATSQVIQAPEMGVRTKNSKAAKTYLLNIPELTAVVKEWDREIRAVLPPDGYWYAHLDEFGQLTTRRPRSNREEARHDFRDDLVDLCARAGIPYLSPHKLRHGFAVYGLKRAKTVAQMKAISQNLMHSNMGITDGIYGKLVDDDVRDIITGLG